MLNVTFMQKLIILSSLLLLNACAQFGGGYREGPAATSPDSYAQSDLDELLGFGANMAAMNEASRSDLCKSLLKNQNEAPSVGSQLHLMVGRLHSESCGDIGKILDGLATIPAGYPSDERLQKLVAIDSDLLRRLNKASKKLAGLERKQKNVQSVLEPKAVKGAKKDDSRLLREKLEAIRAMEKQLDESGEGN